MTQHVVVGLGGLNIAISIIILICSIIIYNSSDSITDETKKNNTIRSALAIIIVSSVSILAGVGQVIFGIKG